MTVVEIRLRMLKGFVTPFPPTFFVFSFMGGQMLMRVCGGGVAWCVELALGRIIDIDLPCLSAFSLEFLLFYSAELMVWISAAVFIHEIV